MEKCCSFHLSDIVCLCMYYFQIDIYIGVFEIFRLLLLSSHMPPPTVHPSFLLTRFICLKFKFLFFFSDFYSYKCLDLNNFVIFRVGAVFMFTKYVRRETGKKNIIPLQLSKKQLGLGQNVILLAHSFCKSLIHFQKEKKGKHSFYSHQSDKQNIHFCVNLCQVYCNLFCNFVRDGSEFFFNLK